MTLSETHGALKRFREIPRRFQQTFRTPLNNLLPFVSGILEAHELPQTASVTIDQVVFEPEHLIALLARNSLQARLGLDSCLTATGQQEIEALLHAVFSDWVDFAFVPTPDPFVIYADHDEYTTFYANKKSNLNRLVETLSERGFERIKDYERRL